MRVHAVVNKGDQYACSTCRFAGSLADALAHVATRQFVVREKPSKEAR